MNRPVAVLGFLAILSRALCAQDIEWVETRFHRVHLRNGNFIDGQLTDQSTNQVSLRMKSGDLTIRNDQVDWIELVKMRSLKEVPKPIAKSPVKPGAVEAKAEGKEGPVGQVALDLSPDALRIRPMVVELVAAYRTAANEGRTKILGQILQTGEEVATVLSSLLEAANEETRDSLIEILSTFKDRRGGASLVKLLATRVPGLRGEVAKLLGLLGDDRATGPLRSLLRDPDSGVRSGALEALGSLGDQGGLSAIVEACSDPEPRVRGRATTVALELGNRFKCLDQVCRELARLMDRAEAPVRVDLVMAIGLTRSEDGEPTLTSAISDSDPAVRAQAVKALASLGTASARKSIQDRVPLENEKLPRVQLAIAANRLKLVSSMESLIGWLRDDDPSVQSAVGGALRGMTGQEFGTDQALWQQWWERARGSK